MNGISAFLCRWPLRIWLLSVPRLDSDLEPHRTFFTAACPQILSTFVSYFESIMCCGVQASGIGNNSVAHYRVEKNGLQNIAKQDPGSAGQNREARAVTKFTKPHANHYSLPSTGLGFMVWALLWMFSWAQFYQEQNLTSKRSGCKN